MDFFYIFVSEFHQNKIAFLNVIWAIVYDWDSVYSGSRIDDLSVLPGNKSIATV